MPDFLHPSLEARWLDILEHGASGPRAETALRLAENARDLGEYERAQNLLRTVCHAGDPAAAPRAAFTLASLLADLGRGDEANVTFDLAADLSNPHVTPDVHLNLAARWATLGRPADAANAYLSVIHAITPRSDSWQQEEASIASFRLGDLLIDQADTQGAEQAYRRALSSGDETVAPHASLALATLLDTTGAPREEIDSLLHLTIGLDHPDCSPNAALCLAARLAKRGNRTRAYELLNMVIESEHPDCAPQAQHGLDALRSDPSARYLEQILEHSLDYPAASALQGPRIDPFPGPDSSDEADGDRVLGLLRACATSLGTSRTRVDVVGYAPYREPAARGNTTVCPGSQPLDCRSTFDQFVIGNTNRLAHAAALTVAEMPGQAYNPLFICGPPGVGKTHLLSSIASLLCSHNPGLSVLATTGEAFTNEFLGALSGGHTDAFKTNFRQVDVLLVDDVQFLERKTKTEEEFFHTFNALYDAGRQIVLTSDRPPQDLQALEDRLRERFEAGLVADIAPPDLPTRLGILRKRVQYDKLEVGDSRVLTVLAERFDDNVRALQGALIRLVAFSSLTGRPLTKDLAVEILDGLYPASHPRTTQADKSPVTQIQTATCQAFGISREELLSTARVARVSWPRDIAIYLARELSEDPPTQIARDFGRRDHRSALRAWRRVTKRRATDTQLDAQLRQLERRLIDPAIIGRPPAVDSAVTRPSAEQVQPVAAV